MCDAKIIAADRLTRNKPIMRQTCGSLKNYWYVACRAEDLGSKKPIGRTILEERLVLWRDKGGQAIAMADRCLHRNAPLSEGELFDGCVACPYHGWMYDAEGKCVNVPSAGPEGSPAKVQIETFPVREQDGLIWVFMGGKGVTPEVEPFMMPFYDVPGWKRYYMVTEFDNGVTALVENFMDVPHTVFVHKGWFRNRTKKAVDMHVERTPNSVLVTYDQPDDEIGFTRLILNPKGLPMKHTDNFYMPNVTRVDYLWGEAETGFVITSQCTPVGPHKSTVYTLISYKLPFPTPALNRFLQFYTRRVIQQDVDIMRVHGSVMRHYEERAYMSTDADLHHVYIESLRDHAEAGGTEASPEPEEQRVRFWI